VVSGGSTHVGERIDCQRPLQCPYKDPPLGRKGRARAGKIIALGPLKCSPWWEEGGVLMIEEVCEEVVPLLVIIHMVICSYSASMEA